MIIFIRSAPVFNCHLRLKVESGDDAELFDRTTAGGRSSFVDPRSNPGTKGKRVRERESKEREEISSLSSSTSGAFPARDVPRRLSPYDISSAASPPLSLCHSLRSSFDGKDHACAQNDVLHARSRAHTQNVCARASDLRSYSLSCLIFL